MRFMDVRCPRCGATITVSQKQKSIKCEYCGTNFLINNRQHHTIDNAEEAGYKFEKGRQRAQAEVQRKRSVYQPNQNKPPKKKRTWLWILGWIIIFPVPLTILMIRKKNMNVFFRYGIIILGWLLYFNIANSNSSNNSNMQNNTSTSTTSQQTVAETGSNEVYTLYKNDVVIDQYLKNFKAMNPELSLTTDNIENGNIKIKCFLTIANTYTEILNANTGKLELTIQPTNDYRNDLTPVKNIFPAYIKAFNNFITDAEITEALNSILTGQSVTLYELTLNYRESAGFSNRPTIYISRAMDIPLPAYG